MNLAEWTIRKSLLAWVITVLFLVVGWSSYQKLSRLEDPEFTIKDAVVMTQYPGASAAEVEEEVTNVIEKAVQEMGQLKKSNPAHHAAYQQSTSPSKTNTIKLRCRRSGMNCVVK